MPCRGVAVRSLLFRTSFRTCRSRRPLGCELARAQNSCSIKDSGNILFVRLDILKDCEDLDVGGRGCERQSLVVHFRSWEDIQPYNCLVSRPARVLGPNIRCIPDSRIYLNAHVYCNNYPLLGLHVGWTYIAYGLMAWVGRWQVS